mmetsp:Transcript_50291/g.99036  ORF Transcript_50291/g.99036 Transcript_50291/m.99036 type:complete len:107 (-) Transcript_50291:1863-2183(-)
MTGFSFLPLSFDALISTLSSLISLEVSRHIRNTALLTKTSTYRSTPKLPVSTAVQSAGKEKKRKNFQGLSLGGANEHLPSLSRHPWEHQLSLAQPRSIFSKHQRSK